MTGVLFNGDAQRGGVDADARPLPALDRFPVHMEEQRLIGFDRGSLDVADRAAGNPLDGSIEQARDVADCPPSRALLHHDQVEQPVVEKGVRRNARAVIAAYPANPRRPPRLSNWAAT